MGIKTSVTCDGPECTISTPIDANRKGWILMEVTVWGALSSGGSTCHFCSGECMKTWVNWYCETNEDTESP